MAAESEFSRPVAVADLGDEEAVVEIVADAGERAALAGRFGLVALDSLAATVRLRQSGGGRVLVAAHCRAQVVQSCVVTLEPVVGQIDEQWEIMLAPPGEVPRNHVDVGASDEDEPEPLIGETIDVGEMVATQLGLALDPYPRRPGAVFSTEQLEDKDENKADSPFAVLRDLVPRS